MKRWLFALSLGLVAWLLSPPIQATATPEFENQYLKIRIPPGWTVAATEDQVLNLVQGKYLLSIDPIFTHASGIIGGRFAEYAGEKQSIKAVMANVAQPAGGFECAEMPADAILVSENRSPRNLYTDSSKIGNGCVFPSSGRPVWFGSGFSGPGRETDYAITLTYSSDKLDDFPSKDSPELRRVFAEVKGMLKSLQLKPPTPAQNSQQAQGNQASNSAVPRFEQYKVTKIYRGKPAVPVLRTPEDREYRTRIREGARAGPNFAGHYTVIIIGCGTECASFVIVDAASGRVFSRAQKEYTCAPIYKVNSRLLTTDVCTGAIQKNCNRAFWEWTGTELKFLTRSPIDCW